MFTSGELRDLLKERDRCYSVGTNIMTQEKSHPERSGTEEHLRQVRIEKLDKLRELGKTPYPISLM